MILSDLAKVLVAPHKVFKQIVQNPKYLGAVLVLVLFVVSQVGFQYAYYQNIHFEGTTPDVNKLGSWTTNSTLWSSNAAITSNSTDVLNATNNLYGTSSLQFDRTNSSSVSMAIPGPSLTGAIGVINCGSKGYQNFSIRVREVSPNSTPQSVNLTLYSNSDANYFQKDITSLLSSASTGEWQNLTIQVGSSASGWQSTGNANWENITAIKLDLSFPQNSSVTVRLEGMFFRGMWQTAVQSDSTGFLIYVLQLVFTQFLFEWLILSAVMYIIIKVLKGNIVWKPLFIAVGCGLIVLVIQAILNAAVTPTLGTIYLPTEVITNLQGEALAISNATAPLMATFNTLSSAIQLVVWIWIGALGTFITKAVIPEFSWAKCVGTAAGGLIVTIILLRLLVGV
jgi:hypothetical protein